MHTLKITTTKQKLKSALKEALDTYQVAEVKTRNSDTSDEAFIYISYKNLKNGTKI